MGNPLVKQARLQDSGRNQGIKTAELSSCVASEASLTSTDADSIVNAVFTDIGDALARGDTVRISGFGPASTSARVVC